MLHFVSSPSRLGTVLAIFFLLLSFTSFSIMSLKSNHMNIGFKYKTSITKTLDVTILKVCYCLHFSERKKNCIVLNY